MITPDGITRRELYYCWLQLALKCNANNTSWHNKTVQEITCIPILQLQRLSGLFLKASFLAKLKCSHGVEFQLLPKISSLRIWICCMSSSMSSSFRLYCDYFRGCFFLLELHSSIRILPDINVFTLKTPEKLYQPARFIINVNEMCTGLTSLFKSAMLAAINLDQLSSTGTSGTWLMYTRWP